jgi:hypothetical protein
MSKEFALLISRTLASCASLADSFQVPGEGYLPAGSFGADRAAIQRLDGRQKQVWEKLHATTATTAGMLLAHALDHVRGMCWDLQRQPVPIWSQLTLARAVLESTVLMCHLLDPSVSTEVRICRQAALWLDDSRNFRNAAATFGKDQAKAADEYYKFQLNELTEGGFDVEFDHKGRPIQVRLATVKVPLSLSTTDEAARILPRGAPSPYRLGSGAGHGRPWFLERSATVKAGGGFEGEGTTALTAALTAMYCMIAWAPAWAGYFGVDGGDQVTQIRESMALMLRDGMTVG